MAKALRKATIKRKTTETDISLTLGIDGTGKSKVDTGIPFFDHMLTLFSRHGLFDLKLKVKGDIEIDFHHTIEDTAITLGEAFKKALGDKAGIRRYGRADVPMVDSLASVVVDISGRPYLRMEVAKTLFKSKARKEEFDERLTEEFMRAISNNAGLDLHIDLPYGKEIHHAIEAIFKAFGRAMRVATERDPRVKGVMSTKGTL
ncbi:Imidazoleglycerol-phosphate dehydratase [hydrothermal vent metagenome]|uniref:Imidazoleglycerol-phosphate dehydratase n=1 Tax=hydrothermal vent metagenome TaxID=652676 RepID=A0A3B0QRX4_9ZZZZ